MNDLNYVNVFEDYNNDINEYYKNIIRWTSHA